MHRAIVLVFMFGLPMAMAAGCADAGGADAGGADAGGADAGGADAGDNVCGDGVVSPPVEECDDGNLDDTDLCKNDCTLYPSGYRWTRRIGGTPGGINWGRGVAFDAAGNVYFTGFMWGTVDFAEDWGMSDVKVSAGSWDGYVTKVNSDGTYGWTRRFGGPGLDYADDLVIDSSGNLYAAGYFADTVDFAEDWGASDVKSAAVCDEPIFGDPMLCWDSMLIRINADGSYGWTGRWGGDGAVDFAFTIALAASGDLLVGGQFQGTVDFGEDFGSTDVKSALGDVAGFLLEVAGDGTYVTTRHVTATTGTASIGAVTVSPSGTVYMAGGFSGTIDFGGAWETPDSKTSDTLSTDVFVTAVDGDGAYLWTRRLGGGGEDYATGLATDSSGNLYVAGAFRETVVFAEDWGLLFDAKISAGENDVFVTRIESDGSYSWTRRWGGPCLDPPFEQFSTVAADSTGLVYVAASWSGCGLAGVAEPGMVNFAEDWGAADARTGLNAGSVTAINPDGTYAFTRVFGGPEGDYPLDIAVGPGDAVYMVGRFVGTVDFAADWGGSDIKTAVGADIFVMKFYGP